MPRSSSWKALSTLVTTSVSLLRYAPFLSRRLISLLVQNEKLIRNRKDFVRVEGQKKDGVKFRNSALHTLNEDYKKFNRFYEQKQAQIVASVVATTGDSIICLLFRRAN